MTTHHSKFSIHMGLWLVGLTTKEMLPMALVQYNTNVNKIYNILSLLWQENKGKRNRSQSRDKLCRY